MVALTDGDRFALWADYMRVNDEETSLIKPELRAAVDATDDWIEANKASFNSALPLPARTSLTARQKARLFMAVAGRKFEVSLG
ncbi:hypothetical protein LCGC14_2958740 [marine sediment metagenome]|uniref:Uncharacterized protein n=1 Tax=marine sediment metagenome TaxID=412755 RepID=A0A0F9A478_9ZZZZ